MVQMSHLAACPDVAVVYPPDMQVAALCWRKLMGKKEVLLITSRDTGRWIVPKGWPIEGLNGAQSALREAWEEAGVRAEAARARPCGQFRYEKILKDGSAMLLVARLYKVRLRAGDLADRFPEAGQRQRLWVRPKKAAQMVEEPDLQAILRAL
ncbi:NUDIX hydrolase [Roseovarius autotrophicus]|uniref:NUDIX hydrolase n=1 Tax=Roseovarius autotrophicus TaxID=2824121 RepID=UPI001FFD9699|nr:NUDIX hydrolase [Roseovarius autotrophicus]